MKIQGLEKELAPIMIGTSSALLPMKQRPGSPQILQRKSSSLLLMNCGIWGSIALTAPPVMAKRCLANIWTAGTGHRRLLS